MEKVLIETSAHANISTIKQSAAKGNLPIDCLSATDIPMWSWEYHKPIPSTSTTALASHSTILDSLTRKPSNLHN